MNTLIMEKRVPYFSFLFSAFFFSWFSLGDNLVFSERKAEVNIATTVSSSSMPTMMEICDNGMDDDGDGLVDCDDPDCNSSISATPTATSGNCNDPLGSIEVIASGNAPFSYVWDDMAPSGHWTFEKTTDDVSGNGNHQNRGATSTLEYEADAIEGVYSAKFSGNDYIRYSVDGDYMEVFFNYLSFSAWIKPANLTGIKTILDEGGGTNGIAMRLNGATLEAAVRNGRAQFNAGSLTIPNDGRWHHVAMVFNNGKFKLYLDGAPGTEVTASYTRVNNHSGNGGLGYYDGGSGFGGGSGNYFVGLMDDVRLIHGDAWTDTQILDLARNDGDRFGLADGNYTVTVTNGAACKESMILSETLTTESNFTDGGTIATDQTICSGSTPNSFTDITAPSGGIGVSTNYQWQSSTDNSTFNDILGATFRTYSSGALSQTTYFRRGAYRTGCSSRVYSNTLTVNVVSNITSPGTIFGDQTQCGTFDPFIISNSAAASGGSGGSIQYQWESSTDNSTWNPISSSLAASFDPPTVTQTTYYRRAARRSSCTAWIYSNVVEKTVINNVNTGGTIGSNESNCIAFDPSIITEQTAPTGGSGSLLYRWEQKIGTGAWTNIGGAIYADYDPPGITQTTQYRRGAKRNTCSAFIYSNVVTKTVTASGSVSISIAPTGLLCEGFSYDFGSTDYGAGATYSWDFGAFGIPNTANGRGNHSVSFDVPNTSVSTEVEVVLNANNAGCPATDTVRLDVRPSIEVNNIQSNDPSTCSSNNGSITMDVSVPTGTGFEVSIDGGATWENVGRTAFSGLKPGNYNIHVRYDDTDCERDYGSVSISEPSIIESGIEEQYSEGCVGEVIYFTADFDLGITSYLWDFGSGAIPATADGIGPHAVTYFSPNNKNVSLLVSNSNCSQSYNQSFNIHENFSDGGLIDDGLDLCVSFDPPEIQNLSSPTGGSVGTPEFEWEYRTYDANNIWQDWIAISGSNGATYDPPIITEPIQFRRKARRSACGEYMNSNVITFHPAGTPDATIDNFNSVCPGVPFGDNISSNDNNLLEPEFSIYTAPTNGFVTLLPDGSFVFEPNLQFCGTDYFIYQVCNYGGTCCDTASVKLNLGDTVKPKLLNIPDSITIHCDEPIPSPPDVIALENCISVSLDMDQISTQGIDNCSLYDYEITRVWTATDYCGNSTAASQVITVKDITAPNIYRIYTLPNGKKMVGGVMKNVGTNWKQIGLPISFATDPVIFAQTVSNNDPSAVVVQLRNISTSQFEMRLKEEEANDNEHEREDVAWFAIEKGDHSGGFEVDLMNVNQTLSNAAFTQSYTDVGLLTTSQTTYESDPVSVRVGDLSSSGVSLQLQEEKSSEPETTHLSESVGYFAFANVGDIQSIDGEVIGESGKVTTTQNWLTVTLNHVYKNPIVVASITSQNGTDPSVLRVSDLTSSSFKVRVQEWDYLDGIHPLEHISYIVIEGSVPFDMTASCDAVPDPLDLNIEIVAVDNCDLAINLEFSEQPNTNNCAPDNELIRTWSSTDACGNTTSFSRIISVFDDKKPEFTVPADVTVSCLDDFNDLTLTGDVIDESDNCAVGVEANYSDSFTGASDCSESYIINRNWTLTDGCGNNTSKIQNIFVQHEGVQFQVKMKLQGALHGETNITPTTLMRDDLRAKGLLPTLEPYTDLPGFAHVNGGGGETVAPEVFDVTGPDAIVDWIFIEIRSDTILDSVMATRSALLQRDGDVVDLDGFSPIVFKKMKPGDYNVLIRHRNHLPMMTGSSWHLTDDPTNTDLNFFEQRDTVTAGPGHIYECLDYDGDGKVLFCKNPENPNKKRTKYATTRQWKGQKRNGAICGPCGDYVTVQDGAWSDPATWKDGIIPQKHLTTGGEIVIRHNLTVANDLSFYNHTTLWIENANLNVTGSIYMVGGMMFTRGADINLTNNFSADSLFRMEFVGTRMNVQGSAVLNNCRSFFQSTCLEVEGDFKISSGRSTMVETFVKINTGGFLAEKTELKPYIEVNHTGFEIKSGYFKNQGTIEGEFEAIHIHNDKIINEAIWNARILHYCATDVIDISSSKLPSSPECGNINDYFIGFNCSQIAEISGTDGTVDDTYHLDIFGIHPAFEGKHGRANWGADLNGDGLAIFQGPTNDVTKIFLEIIGDDDNIQGLANFIRYAYAPEDYDMDGKIIYQGPENDAVKVLFDVILRHPANVQKLANFIVVGQAP